MMITNTKEKTKAKKEVMTKKRSIMAGCPEAIQFPEETHDDTYDTTTITNNKVIIKPIDHGGLPRGKVPSGTHDDTCDTNNEYNNNE